MSNTNRNFITPAGATVIAIRNVPRDKNGNPDPKFTAKWLGMECQNPSCDHIVWGPPAKMADRKYCGMACRAATTPAIWVQNNAARLFGTNDQGKWEPKPHTLACRKWRAANRDKARTQGKVVDATFRGVLPAPTQCATCGAKKSDGVRIERHHWSYAPGFEFRFTELCVSCHNVADKARQKLERTGLPPSQIVEIGELFESGQDLSHSIAARISAAMAYGLPAPKQPVEIPAVVA